MPRRRRPNQPGGIFHLTARTIDRQRLFTPPVRTGALDTIARVLPGSGVRLLALAIMPNHLHLVVQQGLYPLGRFMHALLRRIAYLVQRRQLVEGPVFWRPYACSPCLDPEHARNAIVYTHLNPVRARICVEPEYYPWSSHGVYLGDANPGTPAVAHATARLTGLLDPRLALPLFAAKPERSMAELRDDYRRFVGWRLAVDRWEGSDRPPPVSPSSLDALPLAWGQLRWSRELSPLFHSAPTGSGGHPRRDACPDLADIARITLAMEGAALPVELIRGRRGGREYSRLRHLIMRRGSVAGHRNIDIARFLGVSESAVSKVLCQATRP